MRAALVAYSDAERREAIGRLCPKQRRDDLEVVDERGALGLARLGVSAQDRGRMDRREHVRRQVRLDRLAALARNAEAPPEERLRRRRAEAHEHGRLHDRELRVEPRPARGDLRPSRLRVDPPLAARLPLEVLDDVRHVGARPVDPRLLERLVQKATRGTDEWMPFAVLPIARLLADEHELGPRRAFPEHRLSARPPERTRLASGRGFAQRSERQPLREVLRGGAAVDARRHRESPTARHESYTASLTRQSIWSRL